MLVVLSNHMVAASTMATVDNITTPLPLLVGVALEPPSTGSSETHGVVPGVRLVISELPSTEAAELPLTLTLLLLDQERSIRSYFFQKSLISL
jgi:hypothetical protein